MNSTLKSIGAVLAGMLVTAIISIATDSILEALEIFPPPAQGLFVTWMLALAYSIAAFTQLLVGMSRLSWHHPIR